MWSRHNLRRFEGLCILLKRFAFPCRFSDMIPIFGRPVPELWMINNTVIDWVYNHHRHRIMDWNPNVLSPIQLENYAEAVFNKGAALRNCFGFVDGTVRPISRPDENQRVVYNGHKRVHGLKFQSVVIPNGLIAHLYGPVGELLLCLSDWSSLFSLFLPYKNYPRFKNLYLTSDVSGPYYTLFTLHYSSNAILFFFPPFSVVRPTQKNQKVTT